MHLMDSCCRNFWGSFESMHPISHWKVKEESGIWRRGLCNRGSVRRTPFSACLPGEAAAFAAQEMRREKKNIIYYLQRKVRDQNNPPALGNNLPVCTDRYCFGEVKPSALRALMAPLHLCQLHLCLHCAGQGVLKQGWKISFMLNNSKTPLWSSREQLWAPPRLCGFRMYQNSLVPPFWPTINLMWGQQMQGWALLFTPPQKSKEWKWGELSQLALFTFRTHLPANSLVTLSKENRG